ncbi:MAG: hypothetical protein L0Y56_02285 [Nitrospira sp.]|nr:hypothetical protein [Nitrospira sp.]
MTFKEIVKYIEGQCPNGKVEFYHLLPLVEEIKRLRKEVKRLRKDSDDPR